MPKLHSKTKVLDGRGTVLCYAIDPSIWYYRESNGKGGYRSTKLNARNETEAVLEALDAYTAFRNAKGSANQPSNSSGKKKRKGKPIPVAVEEWIKEEQAKHEAGTIGASNMRNKRNAAKHLLEYLEKEGITSTKEITETTLDDYLIYNSSKSQLTLRSEVGYFNTFYTWLKKQRLIPPDVAALRMTPVVKVTGEDLQANPAINIEDWRIIWKEVKRRIDMYKQDQRLHPSVYWWQTFYAYIMIGKNSGLRPGELRRLKWKDVTVIDAGQRSKSDTRHHYIAEISVRRTKTGEPRQVPCKSGLRFLELKEFQKRYIERYYNGFRQITKDDFVFANYTRCEGRVVLHHQFKSAWGSVRDAVKGQLKGHWASDHNYTIYSLRSSFVEDSLMDDVPVHLVAQMTGHDVKVLMRHYSQLDVRRKTMDLAKLPIGQTTETRNIVDF